MMINSSTVAPKKFLILTSWCLDGLSSTTPFKIQIPTFTQIAEEYMSWSRDF